MSKNNFEWCCECLSCILKWDGKIKCPQCKKYICIDCYSKCDKCNITHLFICSTCYIKQLTSLLKYN